MFYINTPPSNYRAADANSCLYGNKLLVAERDPAAVDKPDSRSRGQLCRSLCGALCEERLALYMVNEDTATVPGEGKVCRRDLLLPKNATGPCLPFNSDAQRATESFDW